MVGSARSNVVKLLFNILTYALRNLLQANDSLSSSGIRRA